MSKFDRVADLEALKPVLSNLDMRAGWNKKEPSLWKEPRANFKPMHWRWSDAREGLHIAGGLISTELAERRNLFLVNPIEGNHYSTLRTLVSAYQMIMPKERARSHRHSPHALRLVLEADKDVYTVVDGERIDMAPNDVVLTPGKTWHGHANDGPSDAYWIDFLDVPLVHLLEPMFLDFWPDGFQLPIDDNKSTHLVFCWKDVQAKLTAGLAANKNLSLHKVVLDAYSVPSMELSMTRMLAAARSDTVQTTDNKIFAVVEGSGTTLAGDQTFRWHRGDVMAIPGWLSLSHIADEASTLFCVSDARTQVALGYFRNAAEDNI